MELNTLLKEVSKAHTAPRKGKQQTKARRHKPRARREVGVSHRPEVPTGPSVLLSCKTAPPKQVDVWKRSSTVVLEFMTTRQRQRVVTSEQSETIRTWIHMRRIRLARTRQVEDPPTGGLFSSLYIITDTDWSEAYPVENGRIQLGDSSIPLEAVPLEKAIGLENLLEREISGMVLKYQPSAPKYTASAVGVGAQTYAPVGTGSVLFRVGKTLLGSVWWEACTPACAGKPETILVEGSGLPPIAEVPEGVRAATVEALGCDDMCFGVDTKSRYRDYVARPLGHTSALDSVLAAVRAEQYAIVLGHPQDGISKLTARVRAKSKVQVKAPEVQVKDHVLSFEQLKGLALWSARPHQDWKHFRFKNSTRPARAVTADDLEHRIRDLSWDRRQRGVKMRYTLRKLARQRRVLGEKERAAELRKRRRNVTTQD